MKIGLFTKCFLEPTHIAIAQVLRGLPEHRFHVFAKAYDQVPGFAVPNATAVADLSREACSAALVADCDLIHAIYDGHVAFDAFQLSEQLRRPFLLSFHGGFDTNAKIWKPAVRDMTRAMAERATVVTVVAETDVRRLRELGVKRSIDVVAVPVDFTAIQFSATTVRGELVAIGRLIPKKGYDTAIEALLHMPHYFRLKLIGSGPEEASLRALANRVGVGKRVEFAGFLALPDMLRALSSASVLLHPARIAEDGNAEGTPQVLLWAQALGIPVVAGDSGSLRDVIEDGVTGRLVPPNDAQRLAEQVCDLAEIGPERARIITTAREWVRGRHELSVVLDCWREIYARAAQASVPTSTPDNAFSILTAGKPPRFRLAFDAALAALGGPNVGCSLIESGGQGVIFLAQPLDGPPVVIKVANYQSDDAADIWLTENRLRKEGAVLTELGRRGCSVVPKLHQLDPDGRFLIREFAPGATIQDAALNLPSTTRARLLPLLMRTCSLLFTTFHRGSAEPYVVRDLKPKNLILTNNGDERIILVDVGSARPVGRQSKSARSKIRLGTRNWLYWSPELLLSQGIQADERSDLFSFGATAFYLLLARAPFSNSEPDSMRALDRYIMEYAAVKSDLLAHCEAIGVPEKLAHFLASCLHPLPAERPGFIPLP
jgi:glycosyltransferase involved in cell wall biosynthesis/tRNA A-37 threonylcarbamoyl transferase component Bud32